MDSLPQELVNRIVWFAERYPGQDQWYPAIGQSARLAEAPSQFPRLAGLNRMWKEAVEAITFRSLGIKSNELDTLKSFVTGNRRNCLTIISYTALLPEYSDEACAQEETRDEQRLNDEAFTKGIRDLFIILRAWEDDGVQNSLRLDIESPMSPTDQRYLLKRPEYDDMMYDIAVGKRKDILSDRWAASQIHLLDPENIPLLSNVQHMVTGNGSRALVPRIAPDFAMALPRLSKVEWEFQDCEYPEEDESSDDDSLNMYDSDPDIKPKKRATSNEVRTANRTAFADGISKTRFQSLSSARITFYHEFPSDQRRTCASIIPAGFTYDPFSAALRVLSQNLTTLTVSAHVDSTLFWPSPDEENAVTPTWPHLRHLDVDFDMVSPLGAWYFTGPLPPDHEDDDPARGIIGGADREYNYMDFRVNPDPETFNPFLATLAKAVAKMPVLEFFMLTSEMRGDTGKLHISYHAPGKEAEWGDEGLEDVACRRVYYACEVGKIWVPEPETAEGLRGAGKDKFGGKVIERYVGSQYR